jgi:2-C-methyl-D-erythritol 4-phosphate cytidylyltransferase
LIEGDRSNIKITLPEDLLFAKALVAGDASTK